MLGASSIWSEPIIEILRLGLLNLCRRTIVVTFSDLFERNTIVAIEEKV